MQFFSADATLKKCPWKHEKTALKSSFTAQFFFSTANRLKTSPILKFCSIKIVRLMYNDLAERRREQVEYLVILQSANQSSTRQWVAQKFYQESLAKKPLHTSQITQSCIRRPSDLRIPSETQKNLVLKIVVPFHGIICRNLNFCVVQQGCFIFRVPILLRISWAELKSLLTIPSNVLPFQLILCHQLFSADTTI